MNSVQEIEAAISKLSAPDFAALYTEMREQHHARWERQIEEDSNSGVLDFLLQELDADISAGRTRPVDEICREP